MKSNCRVPVHCLALSISCVTVFLLGCSHPTKEASRSKASGKVSTAPSGEEAAQRKDSLVRFANATPGVSADLYFEQAAMFMNSRYRDVSPYHEWPAARGVLRLVTTGDTSESEVKNTESFGQGGHFLVVATREQNAPLVKVFKEDLTPPPPGKVKVRFIHAAAGAKDVEVFVAGTKKSILRNIGFNSASPYREVDPALAALDLRNKVTGRIALRVETAFFPAGIYTVLLTSNAAGVMEAVQIEDRLGEPATGSTSKPLRPLRVAPLRQASSTPPGPVLL